MQAKRRFILAHHRSPGDLVCLTALARDIHLTYPGQFELDFNTTVAPIWANSPYITKLWNHDPKQPVMRLPDTQMITCNYGKGIKEQNHETIHFCGYFHRDFKLQTGIDVPLHFPYGDIHLSEKEKQERPIEGRYWLLLTGGKSDFTIKVWQTDYFQEVSDRLGEMGLGVVQTGANHGGHWHPKLTGDHVIDLVGWGSFREWVQQIYHAEGVICGVTGAMHMAAALQKPCVVIAGGREAWWWEAYVRENKGLGEARHKLQMPHRFLHTIGLLDCCKYAGCWRNKVVAIGGDKSVCKRPVITSRMPIAECMQMITPNHVMDAVMSYYTDNSLPPITTENCKTPEDCCKAENSPATSKQRTTASIVLPAGVPLKINPRANVRVRDNKAPVVTRPAQAPDFSDSKILDHPSVGGRMTAFILFYGGEEHFELHKRCLSSFLATTPSERIDLRVGSNALNPKSLELIESFVRTGFITKHYRHENNDYKYPVMREMFYDPLHPIDTKWVLWFDDDSICDVEPNWLNMLGTHIVQHHREKEAHMIGAQYIWTTTPKQREVIESRPWYRQRPWREQSGKPSPNGNKIIFATGGFWALTHEAMVAADIPDIRGGLTHTGGDWLIGEQLYQAGYGMKQFNGKKQFVRTSSVPRRGVTMPTIDKVGPLPDRYPTATQPLPSPTKLQLPPLVATSTYATPDNPLTVLRDNAMKDMLATEDAKFISAVNAAATQPIRTNVVRL
jgi:hypothetical protein